MAGPGSSPALQVVGARELRQSARRVGVDLSELKDAHRAAADLVVARARELAPVGVGTRRPGALRDSVRASGTKTAAIVRAGGARVPYAMPIHWGWGRRHIAAQPFLSAAARQTEPGWTELYLRAVDAALDKIEGAP